MLDKSFNDKHLHDFDITPLFSVIKIVGHNGCYLGHAVACKPRRIRYRGNYSTNKQCSYLNRTSNLRGKH